MDEEIERLVVSVRADTAAFARDVAEMRGQLEGPLAQGVEQAGRVLESALVRAVRTGKLGFEDLKRVALAAMAEIAAAAIRGGLDAAFGRGGGAGGGKSGLAAAAAQLLAALLGAPGRATGGPVAPGRPYWVGERGPELFVPTASGRVEAAGGAARDIRLSITVNAPAGAEPQALARSSRQVARAVRQALLRAED
jgi:hypothetical protein